jgi:serine/threonine protein kinase
MSSPEKIDLITKESKIPIFSDDDYEYIDCIGEGAHGDVYLIRDKITNQEYALKKLVCQEFEDLLNIKNKLEKINSLSHENIIKVIKIQFKCLDFTTYAINTVLDRAITDWNNEIIQREKDKNFYTEKELINIAKQIISALAFLQKNNIAHRDIKPQNILIFENNIYKVADFGEMKIEVANDEKQLTIKGSQSFMSPALKDGLKFNKLGVRHNAFKSDVFSLGYCFLYAMSLDMEILEQAREFWGGNKDFKKIEIDIKKYIGKERYSDKFIDFIGKMILEDESKRMDFLGLTDELKNF